MDPRHAPRFDKVVHASFVMIQNVKKPWNVVFTDAEPPHLSYVIGREARGLTFTYEDVCHNSRVEEFPRTGDRVQPHRYGVDVNFEIEDYYRTRLQYEQMVGRQYVWGAADRDTFRYLKSLDLPENAVVKLFPRNRINGIVMSVGIAAETWRLQHPDPIQPVFEDSHVDDALWRDLRERVARQMEEEAEEAEEEDSDSGSDSDDEVQIIRD